MNGTIFLHSEARAARYTTLFKKAEITKSDPDFGAAIYLLSCDAKLATIAEKYIARHGIYFDEIKRAVRNSDEATRIIVDVADNLFTHGSSCESTPFEISRLGAPIMEQILNAIKIESGDAHVIIPCSESGTCPIE